MQTSFSGSLLPRLSSPGFVLFGALLLGACASQSNGASSADPEGEEQPASSSDGAESEAPVDEAPPEGDAGADGAEGGTGRVAFIECESPRKQACTKEYRPVCAEVDTGIRCIQEPCPSTEKKEFANACTACADEKVLGYFPLACDELMTAKAP